MHTRTSANTTNGIHVRLQNELLCAIESFRRSEPDIPTRPEAVRRLLQRALELGSGLDVPDIESSVMPTPVSAKGRYGLRNERK
jgi:hypothetical protein